MGRPTVFKKGAMTPAERQRRRRKKLRRAAKAAEIEAKQAENARKYSASREKEFTDKGEPAWTIALEAPLPSPIDELVAQVADTLLSERIDASEFREAFNRRFPV